MTGDAIIVSAEIGAGHDGAAELVLTIRYQNGVTGPVVLDADTALQLMKNCGVSGIEDLAGQSWRNVLEKR